MLEFAIQWMKDNFKREEGQAMAEYGLILALIAVVVVIALTAIGTNVNTKFNAVVDGLKSVAP